MLEAEKLSKRYGSALALDDLNLHIGPGEIFCLLGANGAGKTTTINLFLNFIAPTTGTAKVDGLDVTKYPQDVRRIIAYLPEQVMLYPRLTGLENLDYFSRLAGHRYSNRELALFLERCGLSGDAAVKSLHSYSKGMRQKAGLAIALAKEARALLLDEPTSGLDPQASFEFSQVLASLARDGVAVLMATHDLFRVKETGTRAGIMRQGRLVDVLETKSLVPADLERLYLDHMRAAPFREAAQ
ncbi:MAG: ABC transporter ATP-binding protein [Beijerinckiaceae bacterium]|nr:ABC transporter ATP-binding protein [Beijerinckiaceae bacterium]MCI0735846.1 ABC transporter ATP-binding protein [Beijerinckiaceae bacterium]